MVFTDQLHRLVEVPDHPVRIVSLVPSQSEFLFDLGLNDTLVGITRFCIHPASLLQTKTRIGGTKTLNIPTIKALKPDLIIGNKEENDQTQIEQLMQEFPVWMSDIHNLEEALTMMEQLGLITGRNAEAAQLINRVRQSFGGSDPMLKDKHDQNNKAAYLIWRKPWMSVSENTFIHDMMLHAGFSNVFAGHSSRYPEFSLDELNEMKPRYVLLSSEPFPFKENHVRELEEQLEGCTVLLVNGELFSWYGSRLLQAAPYLHALARQYNHLF